MRIMRSEIQCAWVGQRVLTTLLQLDCGRSSICFLLLSKGVRRQRASFGQIDLPSRIVSDAFLKSRRQSKSALTARRGAGAAADSDRQRRVAYQEGAQEDHRSVQVQSCTISAVLFPEEEQGPMMMLTLEKCSRGHEDANGGRMCVTSDQDQVLQSDTKASNSGRR